MEEQTYEVGNHEIVTGLIKNELRRVDFSFSFEAVRVQNFHLKALGCLIAGRKDWSLVPQIFTKSDTHAFHHIVPLI